MRTKHTPGPWTYETLDDGRPIDIEIFGPYSVLVATISAENADRQDVVQADARLIAGAPEMAEFISTVAGALNEDSSTARDAWREKIHRARALLAKIKGGE